MRRGFVVLILALFCVFVEVSRAATREVDRSRQCLVVLTDNWSSTTGILRSFERDSARDPWREYDTKIPVVLGKKGLGRGVGLIDLSLARAPVKKEGDNRAPAGLFRLAPAFGYASARSAAWIKLPYLPLTKQIEGIDDPRSRYYNQLVDRSKVAKVDWNSSEQMRRDDVRYKWGIVVKHNPAAIPGAGSCIFLHVWTSPSSTTVGCTAMPERELLRLLRWLEPARDPILVQLPRAVYRDADEQYHLPRVTSFLE